MNVRGVTTTSSPGPMPSALQRDVQRDGAVRQRDGIRHAAPGGELPLELAALLARPVVDPVGGEHRATAACSSSVKDGHGEKGVQHDSVLHEGLAGLPTTVTPGGTDLVTTAPMPTTAPRPMTSGCPGLPCFSTAPRRCKRDPR
jgi:hypothetical protein